MYFHKELFKFLSIQWLVVFIFVPINSFQGQSKVDNMQNQKQTSLLCDQKTGACEIPSVGSQTESTHLDSTQKKVKIIYYTDPICSSCWGIEPALRKLKLEYGDNFDIEYRMGGLLPSWKVYNSGAISKPSDVAHHWDEASVYYQMPIDGDVMIEDPVDSSYPSCIAVKAAQMQDAEKAVKYMRKLREMLYLEKKNICKWENLSAAAVYVGLDSKQLKIDFDGKANDAFQADLDLAKALGVRGFPTMFFQDATQQITIYGHRPYADYEQTLLKLEPKAIKKTIDTSLDTLFAKYETLAAKEYSELTNQSFEVALAFLTKAENDGKLTKTTCKNGSIWRLK